MDDRFKIAFNHISNFSCEQLWGHKPNCTKNMALHPWLEYKIIQMVPVC